VSLDTVRSDHTSAYGYERDTTPELRRLAAQGVRFAQAYAPTATTGPSHATLFTSLYPLAHGVVKNGLALDARYDTLAEILARHGYQTAAVVSSFVLDAKFGYAQGFERYDDDFELLDSSLQTERFGEFEVGGAFDRRAGATSDRALRFLEEEREADRPFFLFLHYFDPHDPYDPPAPWRDRFPPAKGALPGLSVAIGRYDGEIGYTDQQLGRVLAALARLGLERSTLVVVTADHGEELMEHGWMYHGLHIYEESVRIPLILRWPGVLPAGRTVEAPVQLVDLAPTLLALLRVPVEAPAFQGESLAPALLGREALDPERPVFLQRQHYDGSDPKLGARGEKFAVRHGRWKYIHGLEEGTFELFDLVDDPDERQNLQARLPERVEALGEEIEAWRKRYARAVGPPAAVSEEDRRRLEALGYTQ
jgi:arylsulfatase A-like enzyme